MTEHVHDEIGAKTLFATHHHDLTHVADDLPNAINLHFAATERDGEVVFEHHISEGATMASYGVEVAGLAGVPESVIQRSKELLAEGNGEAEDPMTEDTTTAESMPSNSDDVVDELRRTNVAATTPLEALQLLDRLKSQLD